MRHAGNASDSTCVDISRGPGTTRRIPRGNCPGKGIVRPVSLGGGRRVGTPLARRS